MTKTMASWSTHPVGRRARSAGRAVALFAGVGLAALPAPAAAATAQRMESIAPAGIDSFYRARAGQPLWLAPGNADAVNALIALFDSAPLDGIDPAPLNLKQLKKALRSADGNSAAAMRAETMLSDAFVRYVRALRSVDPATAGWQINDPELNPRAPSAIAILDAAAAAPSLATYIERMGFMHASYAGLREALAGAEQRGNLHEIAVLRANLLRTRVLPGSDVHRYILVNTAAQRLYMVEDGKVVDWMKVVVGKPAQQTPMMAAMIRYTAVNPYWNVPSDLAAERIAPNVVKQGPSYLASKGYRVLSDWRDDATRIDPTTIDWQKVASGEVQLRMRQDPGPDNAMGRMKFMFPNPAGVYLHDTPNKELLGEDTRLFSGGCVRLEAAPRLAEWLYGHALKWQGAKPEQTFDLAQPVPVYLAYLTAVPQSGAVVYFDDVYKRDRTALALASR